MNNQIAAPERDPRSVHRSASEASNPYFIRSLVSEYAALESTCDETLERQDILARAMYRCTNTTEGVIDPNNQSPASQMVFTASGALKSRKDLSFRDISFQDFKVLALLAKKTVPPNFVNGVKRFVLNACSFEASEIEELEYEAQILQFKMKKIEQKILDHSPCHPQEVIAKMRYIVGLLLDGSDFEIDYFAYQVEECASALADFLDQGTPKECAESVCT